MLTLRHFHKLQWGLAMVLALGLLLLQPLAARACGGGVICVDADAPTGGNGQTWGTAYKYLQDALAAATGGSEIWVAEGLYKPATSVNRNASFGIPASNVALYGGFAGVETNRDQRNWETNVTVLSGDLGGDDPTDKYGVVLDWSDIVTGSNNVYYVVQANGVSNVVLDGFTITGGYNNISGWDVGAGLFPTYCNNMTLRNLVFQGNRAFGAGGAVYFYEGTHTLTDVDFIGNAASSAGGVYFREPGGATLTRVRFHYNDALGNSGWGIGGGLRDDGNLSPMALTDVEFISNTASYSGGGAFFASRCTISQALFQGNTATETGGGMADEGAGCDLTDATFINNRAFRTTQPGGFGVGAYHAAGNNTYTRVTFEGNASPAGGGLGSSAGIVTITNASFVNNSAPPWPYEGSGGAIWMWDGEIRLINAVLRGNSGYCGGALFAQGGGFNMTNVTAFGNSGSNSACGYAGTVHGGSAFRNSIFYGNGGALNSGGIEYSLVNVDPQFVDSANGDLHLRRTSPAIDAGNNEVTTPTLPATDLDNYPRRADIPSVPDTGNGAAPIVDIGAYEFSLADLRVSKTNSGDGAVARNTPFSWTLALVNVGADDAVFTNTVLLLDDLPTTGATFGTPVVSSNDVSGAVACTVISGSTLRCTASGVVTLTGRTGQITVTLPTTPGALGALINPRSGGVCQADPNSVVVEADETNNDCNSDTVMVGQGTLVAAIHNTSHTVVAGAPEGAAVHGNVQVSGPTGAPAATGSVTFTTYANKTCVGTPQFTEVQTLVNGAADTSAFSATDFSYRAVYGGDSAHLSLTSDCTVFVVTQPGPTFTVTTADDSANDGACTADHCTLREAIVAANQTAGANAIRFAIGERQTILLTAALPAANDANGALTIDGETHTVTVSGNNAYRAFQAASAAHLTLENLTIVYGKDTNAECLDGNSCGGGLKVNTGAVVTLTHSAILTSSAEMGGGIYSDGTLIIQNSTIAGNATETEGGGIDNGGALLIENSTLSGNTAQQYGGAIFNRGVLTLTNSTLSGNIANGACSLYGGGGAIDQWGSGASAVIVNSTIVGNTSANPNEARSGIWLENGVLTLRNSIVANNNGGYNFVWSGGTFTSEGYNLSNAWNGLTIDATDLTTDPLLGTLADNGGETQTRALLLNSPAIDAGDPANCPATDQRGLPRADLRCDIGAFEVQHNDSDTVVKTFGDITTHSFGPTWVSVTLSLTDTGSLTVTKHLAYPGGTSDAGEVQATWWISSNLSDGLPAMLSLCYTDAEVAGLNESSLEMFRWDGSTWVDQNATPDPDNNCVTLAGVAGFSAWTLKDTSVGADTPNAACIAALAARGFAPVAALPLVGLLVLGGAAALRRKRR